MLFPEMSFSLTFFSHKRAYFIQSQLFTSFQNYIPIQKEKQSTFSKETIDNVNFSKSYWLQAGELFWFGVKKLVFCYQNCSDLLWEKIVLVIKKNFWNSRLKAENLQHFWDHWNNFFLSVKGQYNLWNNACLACSWRFLRSDTIRIQIGENN